MLSILRTVLKLKTVSNSLDSVKDSVFLNSGLLGNGGGGLLGEAGLVGLALQGVEGAVGCLAAADEHGAEGGAHPGAAIKLSHLHTQTSIQIQCVRKNVKTLNKAPSATGWRLLAGGSKKQLLEFVAFKIAYTLLT